MSTAKWKMAAGAVACLLGLAGAGIAAFGSLPSTPAPPAPMPVPAAPPQKGEPASKVKTNAELAQDAKDRFAEFEQLLTVITELELLKHRREIYAAGRPGKEDATALTKKVADLERKIQELRPRLKYYTDDIGLNSPSRLPWAIKEIKEELEKLEKADRAKSLEPQAAPTNDLKLLNGEWKVVALEANGKKAPAAEIEGGRWVFSGAEVQFGDPGEKLGGRSSVKLDTTKSPKHIDLAGLEGAGKGITSPGIYKLEKGRLVICLGDPKSGEKGRPTTFATGALGEAALITLERVKDKK
ncbi:TIGR03067 domain-containing protein [Gemmata obscuriglobus]|nr:TIGR03067 domain-containing protein [Gemmata obscuriglobus]